MQQTILILDDDPDIVGEICDSLSDGGFNTVSAGTAKELWELTEQHKISLFILDLVLPDDAGLNVAKTLRESSDVGIIIVSGKAEETDRVVGLEIGADDYVTKPFSPRELQARVKSVLRRTKGQTYPPDEIATQDVRTIVEFEGWTLDMAARHLKSPDGGNVTLTTAEYELLRIFVEQPNRVHTRDFLLDSVHGREWAGYDRGIDGLVSRLRKKLKPNTDDPEFIVTVRGAGYTFSPKVVHRQNN